MNQLPARTEVPESDTWNLSHMYPSLAAWEQEFSTEESRVNALEKYRGRLSESATVLAQAIRLFLEQSQVLERLFTYAHLLSDGDTTNSSNLSYMQKTLGLYTRFSAVSSFLSPELMSLKAEQLDQFLAEPELADLKRYILDVIRYKPHTLSASEESLLAKGGEVFSASSQAFTQLNNADLNFGTIKVGETEKSLSHGSFAVFLKDRDRDLRERAFKQYYQQFDNHKHTIAATLTGSIKRDIYLAQVRNYSSALEAGVFGDNAPSTVYNTLVDTVSKNLAPLHQYYKLRQKHLGLKQAFLFDTYVPIVPEVKSAHSFEKAVSLIVDSLKPLGREYCEVLAQGLSSDRWVDRYENKGKRAGAYSSGCYDSPPYILMNYKEENINDLFTLTHEAGHSMHSYFSRKHQSFQDHGYTIFVAEVASTFNEQLLMKHLKEVYSNDQKMQAFLVNQQLDDIKATFFRQTMFAEFERQTHALSEQNQPLTIDVYRQIYGALLRKYFGPGVTISEIDTLECLRIPHFYSAFYVYKYATGLSAAIALSKQVLGQGSPAVSRYLNFLKAGCSKYPLDLLRDAGVDLEQPTAIVETIKEFERLLGELESLL